MNGIQNQYNAFLSTQTARLDLLIHREILRLQARYRLSLNEFRGLYISDEQVDVLVNETQSGMAIPEANLCPGIGISLNGTGLQSPVDSPWRKTVDRFKLSGVEEGILLIAFAPHLNIKYENLYAYLNNDVARKYATIDLTVRLLSSVESPASAVCEALQPGGRLLGESLVRETSANIDRSTSLSFGFVIADAAAAFLKNLNLCNLTPQHKGIRFLDSGSSSRDTVVPVNGACKELDRLSGVHRRGGPAHEIPVVVLEGRYGSGRIAAARQWCSAGPGPFLELDLAAIMRSSVNVERQAREARLLQKLSGAGICIRNTEILFEDSGRPAALAWRAIRPLIESDSPVALVMETGQRWREGLRGVVTTRIDLSESRVDDRVRAWRRELAAIDFDLSSGDVETLASRFEFTPGQIRDAVRGVEQSLVDVDGVPSPDAKTNAFFNAARSQQSAELENYSVKVDSDFKLEDIVLPDRCRRQIDDVMAAIQDHHLVMGKWGFGDALHASKGAKILLTGPPGTGKTATVTAIAGQLELDLYKIDLSGVVSKYIGETEKNLDKIFYAARGSNAILFFDEADALFGKRSEVKDAHDRYANLEISYLLQKLDERQSKTVFLASNINKNIDLAFFRRMNYVVDFPIPDALNREKIWRKMLPPTAPISDDVDIPFIAKQFKLAGGDIRNVIMSAAFTAAQNGLVINMQGLMQAMSQQMIKQGQVPSPADFKHYANYAQGF